MKISAGHIRCLVLLSFLSPLATISSQTYQYEYVLMYVSKEPSKDKGKIVITDTSVDYSIKFGDFPMISKASFKVDSLRDSMIYITNREDKVKWTLIVRKSAGAIEEFYYTYIIVWINNEGKRSYYYAKQVK